MAISNCIGSNEFDLSIGIGLPYLLNSLIRINTDFTQMYTGVYSNLTFTVLGLVLCLSLFLILLNLTLTNIHTHSHMLGNIGNKTLLWHFMLHNM